MVICANCKKSISKVDFNAMIIHPLYGQCANPIQKEMAHSTLQDGIKINLQKLLVLLKFFSFSVIVMPDESCRKCGGVLLSYSLYGKCRASTRFICRICGTVTLE